MRMCFMCYSTSVNKQKSNKKPSQVSESKCQGRDKSKEQYFLYDNDQNVCLKVFSRLLYVRATKDGDNLYLFISLAFFYGKNKNQHIYTFLRCDDV